MADDAPWRTEQGTHKFTIEALFKNKEVLRCERRMCLVIWHDPANKPKPSTTCWGKDD